MNNYINNKKNKYYYYNKKNCNNNIYPLKQNSNYNKQICFNLTPLYEVENFLCNLKQISKCITLFRFFKWSFLIFYFL
jgi:hypothetical protein